LALSKNIANQMANVRLGLQFPVKRTENLNINMNIFGDFNDYIFNEPILNEPTERPNSILFRSIGISLGIQF